jgi:hypothetical protein
MIYVTSLEQRAVDRIDAEYPASEREALNDLLATYAGPERDRVIWDILVLSRGDSQKLLHFLQCAQVDYRDILYWAEYYDNDPMLKDCDPRKLVNELLAKWS